MKKAHISKNTIKFILPFAVASVIRIMLGYFAGAWFPGEEFWDDALMARYSEIVAHFMLPNIASLLKYMAYPLFLCAVGITHIPITIWISMLWLIAGYLCYYVARKLGLPKWLSFCSFLYMSFMPEAFEKWCGTRLYRSAIVGPFVAITLLLMIVLFFKLFEQEDKKTYHTLWAAILGLFTSFTYYIKEDGVWILACLLFAMLVWAFALFLIRKKQDAKGIIGRIVSIILPLMILMLVTIAYKGINYKCFGVFATNTRTSSESGKFMSLVYTIDSPNRTAEIWAPIDAIEKAFEASDTLGANPELLQSIKTSAWLDGDIYTTPIHGDFLGWVLYSAGPESGTWTNDKEKEAFFTQVNCELEEAFEEGRLKKISGRIVLVSSGGSRTIAEIFDLHDEVVAGYKGAILYDGYDFGVKNYTRSLSENAQNVTALMIDRTGLDYLFDYTEVMPVFDTTGKITKAMSYVYIVVNVLMVLMFFANIPIGIVLLVKNRKSEQHGFRKHLTCFANWFMSVVFAGIAFMYTFAIGWFSSFLHVNGIDKRFLNFYNVALPVLLALSYLFALSCFYGLIKAGKNYYEKNRKNECNEAA